MNMITYSKLGGNVVLDKGKSGNDRRTGCETA